MFYFYVVEVYIVEKITLKVKGMHCPSCEMLVKDSIEDLSGVRDANASFKRGIVEVEGENINLNIIRQIINDEGYEVEE